MHGHAGSVWQCVSVSVRLGLPVHGRAPEESLGPLQTSLSPPPPPPSAIRCRRRCRCRRRALRLPIPPQPRIPPPSPSNPLRVVGGLPRHYTGHLVIGCDASPPRPPPPALLPPSPPLGCGCDNFHLKQLSPSHRYVYPSPSFLPPHSDPHTLHTRTHIQTFPTLKPQHGFGTRSHLSLDMFNIRAARSFLSFFIIIFLFEHFFVWYLLLMHHKHTTQSLYHQHVCVML